MASTATMRSWWADYLKKTPTEVFTFLSRYPVKADPVNVEAWKAMEQALEATGYGAAQIVSSYYPRYISGTTNWSLHSYPGLAVDIDPFSAGNPFTHNTPFSWADTKFTPQQVEAVKAIRTNNGIQVWRWGGDSFGTYTHDYMHWQLNCRPSDIATGVDWATVPEHGEDDMILNSKSEAVADVQASLIVLGYDLGEWAPWGPGYPKGADGSPGAATATAVASFQIEKGLPETSTLDSMTVALIHHEAAVGVELEVETVEVVKKVTVK